MPNAFVFGRTLSATIHETFIPSDPVAPQPQAVSSFVHEFFPTDPVIPPNPVAERAQDLGNC